MPECTLAHQSLLLLPLPLPAEKPALPRDPGTPLTTLGWGAPAQKALQHAGLALQPLAVCSAAIRRMPDFSQPANTLICAGSQAGSKQAACVGDAGAPLLLAPKGGQPGGDLLLGVAPAPGNGTQCSSLPGEPARLQPDAAAGAALCHLRLRQLTPRPAALPCSRVCECGANAALDRGRGREPACGRLDGAR